MTRCRTTATSCQKKIKQGETFNNLYKEMNYLVFCKEGEVHLTSSLFREEILYSGEIMFLPHMADCQGEVRKDTHVVIHYLCRPLQPDKILTLTTKIFNQTGFYRGGSGKEHVAYEIHARSHREHKSYLTVDCGAVSDELAASDFFAHHKGAFRGVDSDKAGSFRVADRGTLYLDDIDNISYKTQMLLLRVLQEKRFQSVGSTREFAFNIRVVTATNENLEKTIAEGRFPEDLFHRLNEFTLHLSPLIKCREDIFPFAYFFFKLFYAQQRKRIQGSDNKIRIFVLSAKCAGSFMSVDSLADVMSARDISIT